MSLEFDVFAWSAPNGTSLGTLNRLEAKEVRPALYEPGHGRFVMNRADAAQLVGSGVLDFGNIVKVRLTEVHPTDYQWAFRMEEGAFDLVSLQEEVGEVVEYSGRGLKALVGDDVMLHESYVGDDPFTGLWRLWNAGTGNAVGQMWKRVLDEFLHVNRPYTALPFTTYDFDATNDSNGNPWTLYDANFEVSIGDSGLRVGELMQTIGLIRDVTPNLVERAFESFGTDRSSATFAAGKVRIEKGVNIETGLAVDINSEPYRSRMLVEGSGYTYELAEDASATRVRAGHFRFGNSNSPAILAVAGQSELRRLAERADEPQVGIIPGDDEANGRYLPWKHFNYGDTVTLHTGAGEGDYNEATFPIQAFRIVERAAGADAALGDPGIDVVLELNRFVTAAGSGQHVPAPPGGGNVPLTCDNYATAGVLTGKWVNPSVAVDVTNWRDTPNTGAAARVASPGGSPPAPWSFRGNTNHRWHTFDGETFEEGKSYAIAFWVYDTVAGTGGSGAVRIGHSLVSVTNHWGPGDYEDTVFESYPDLVSATWTKQCVIWTPTATYTDDVRIDFHLQDQYITGGEVWESATGGVPLPPTEDGAVGDPSQFATATHQHPFQEAGDTPYDDADAALGADDVQEAIDALDAALDALAGATGDHGGLTGLADDDHIQYVLKTLGGKETVSTVAASGSAATLDLADGNWHDLTLSENCTLTLTGATAGTGCSMLILLRPAGFTVTWPGSVAWTGGEEPDLTDVELLPVSLITNDGGTTWLGAYPGVSGDAAAGGTGTAFTVDPGTPTYDDTGPGFVEVSVTSKFGIDSGGDPYFNDAGVTSGEEAALMRDSETGAYFLRPYTF